MKNYVVNVLNRKSKINKEIYGHFSEHLGRCIYEGLFVGEDSPIPNVKGMRKDVVEALKKIRIPVLRWPGGCFADEYHWMDGIGDPATRKRMINTHWGGVVEDNSFGTHEFMELCRQLGCEPYINGNVGSGTVEEMQNWVEYLTFDGVSPMSELRKKNGREEPWKVKYFGVGNENWGCGGNMRPEYYADLYRRYQTYVRNYGDNKIYRIACGPGDEHWTDTIMSISGRFLDAITLHHYTVTNTWQNKGSATEFTLSEYYTALQKALEMEPLIVKHSQIMRRYDPQGRVGLIVDEWGTWHDVEPGTNPGFLYQQNTMRDALVAGLTLNIFNKYSDRVVMANIAQLINVLQAVILTEGEKMLLTPTYHVFDMYKEHQDADLLESFLEVGTAGESAIEIPQLHESASVDKDGKVHITFCNFSHDKEASISAQLVGKKAASATGSILAGSKEAYNTFENPEEVKPKAFTAFTLTEKGFDTVLPPLSVVSLTLE